MALNIHILPNGIDIEHIPGTTILDSALAAGITMRHSCDAGSCHICRAKLLKGRLTLTNPQQHSDVPETVDEQSGCHALLLCCKAYPETDCILEIENVFAKGELPLMTVACQLREVTPLNHDVTLYVFKLPAGKKIKYHAGQYLEVVLNEGEDNEKAYPFSIANAVNSERTLELHIRDIPNSDSLERLKSALVEGEVINIRLPKGDCTLCHIFDNGQLESESNTPLIFLAGSTGFAPVKAMVEACIEHQVKRPIYVYWGGRTDADIYLNEVGEQWAEEQDNISYIPVVSEPENCQQWQGRTGFVHKAVMEDFLPFTSDITIIAGGSPGMVHAAYDDFIEAGLDKSQLHSDVFAYAPKS
ncbi:MAG: FAD-binding oxidoreductase [Pseudomonadales bacterium]|nr:FAD-binding oxidoreductase [Pseudomonadales bacterium]